MSNRLEISICGQQLTNAIPATARDAMRQFIQAIERLARHVDDLEAEIGELKSQLGQGR